MVCMERLIGRPRRSFHSFHSFQVATYPAPNTAGFTQNAAVGRLPGVVTSE